MALVDICVGPFGLIDCLSHLCLAVMTMYHAFMKPATVEGQFYQSASPWRNLTSRICGTKGVQWPEDR